MRLKKFLSIAVTLSVAFCALSPCTAVFADTNDDFWNKYGYLYDQNPELFGQMLAANHQQEVNDYIKEQAYKDAEAKKEAEEYARKQYAEKQKAMQEYWQKQNCNDWHWCDDRRWCDDWRWRDCHRDCRVSASGVRMSTERVTLTVGQTYQITGYVVPDNASNKSVCYYSENTNIVSVDGSGNLRANGVGACYVTAKSDDGGHTAHTYVTVNAACPYVAPCTPVCPTVPACPAANICAVPGSNWLNMASASVLAAPKKGTISLTSDTPQYLDTVFANTLKSRPDVTVNIIYNYGGHTFNVKIPAGYNLTKKLNAAGVIDFVTLSNIKDGKITCTLLF